MASIFSAKSGPASIESATSPTSSQLVYSVLFPLENENVTEPVV
jgi:hypothetical protein